MTLRKSEDPQHSFQFLDVNDEPLKVFPSIKNYESTPLVSLDKAVVPLETVVFDVQRMVHTVKASCGEVADGLSRDESNSIRLYTLEWQPKEKSLFHIFNRTLRSDDRKKLQPWLLFLRLILAALSRVPSASPIVYRGINIDLTPKYSKDTILTWWGFSSCMKRPNMLDKKLFFGKTGTRTLFIINCQSGKDIHRHSSYESEEEVLLPPGCQFQMVRSVNEGRGLHVIELNEIQTAVNFYNGSSPATDQVTFDTTFRSQFQPVSTVALSKKLLPAALPNAHIEERLNRFFKQPKTINLDEMRLVDTDMDLIISEIIIHRQCTELNLSKNHFTSKSITLFAYVLRKNKTLTILHLGYNKIGDEGAQSLGAALQTNSTLTTLDLGRNSIENKGAQAIGAALQTNSTLTTLHLTYNKIGDEGAQSLGTALQTNSTLTRLDLGSNSIGDAGAQSLGTALQTNSTVTEVLIVGNPINPNVRAQVMKDPRIRVKC